MSKKVVVSCGPIPARLDSVKFLTNRFKGGLAFATAAHLATEAEEDVTVVTWEFTPIPAAIDRLVSNGLVHVVKVRDVFEYYDWFVANAKNFDAFVMAAAVANLTPVKPYEGKFPSHLYNPGDEFDIKFMIAPRAIDAIKKLNPRACLIGYKLFDASDDESLVEIARHTLADSKANVIFANTPVTAKSRKLALTQDGAVIPCTYEEHNAMIARLIKQEYFRTEVQPLSASECDDIDIREARATVEMFEHTFSKFGTVAVPVANHPGMFATTSRGHKSGSVIIRSVDRENLIVHASGKATLNAPALSAMLQGTEGCIVTHRHEDDPLYGCTKLEPSSVSRYIFPGTADEYDMAAYVRSCGAKSVTVPHHGYLALVPIHPIDWSRYHELFPEKYFGIPEKFQEILSRFEGKETLEIGGNANPTGKFSYDPYVEPRTAIRVSWNDLVDSRFDLGFAKNAINYLTMHEIKTILKNCRYFVANTFLEAPTEKITDSEAAVLDGVTEKVLHTLRLPDDSIMRHSFRAYSRWDYQNLGLSVEPYGKNSALLTYGFDD